MASYVRNIGAFTISLKIFLVLITDIFIRFSTEYCIYGVLIGSFNSGYQLIFPITFHGNALGQLLRSLKKAPSVQTFRI